MKDFGKYFFASTVVGFGAWLTVTTGKANYFLGALWLLAFLGFYSIIANK